MIADSIVFAPVAGSAPCTAADFIALLEMIAGRNGVPADLPAFIATFPADQVDDELRVRGIADTAQLMFIRYQAARFRREVTALEPDAAAARQRWAKIIRAGVSGGRPNGSSPKDIGLDPKKVGEEYLAEIAKHGGNKSEAARYMNEQYNWYGYLTAGRLKKIIEKLDRWALDGLPRRNTP